MLNRDYLKNIFTGAALCALLAGCGTNAAPAANGGNTGAEATKTDAATTNTAADTAGTSADATKAGEGTAKEEGTAKAGAEEGTAKAGAEDKSGEAAAEPAELTVLAAASLTDVCNEIKELYEAEYPNVTLNFSYGGSGALQTQIEEGAPCDVFISAAKKQMNALKEEKLMDDGSVTELLENKVVLIVPSDSTAGIEGFEDAATDKVTMIALGEPGSVPVGQYAEEIFTNLNILDAVKAKANYGTDVRQVLDWVETKAVDCGVVYATDAAVGEGITVVCAAPEGSVSPVIYPCGITAASEEKEAAADFITYLQSEDITKLFEKYGFTAIAGE